MLVCRPTGSICEPAPLSPTPPETSEESLLGIPARRAGDFQFWIKNETLSFGVPVTVFSHQWYFYLITIGEFTIYRDLFCIAFSGKISHVRVRCTHPWRHGNHNLGFGRSSRGGILRRDSSGVQCFGNATSGSENKDKPFGSQDAVSN